MQGTRKEVIAGLAVFVSNLILFLVTVPYFLNRVHHHWIIPVFAAWFLFQTILFVRLDPSWSKPALRVIISLGLFMGALLLWRQFSMFQCFRHCEGRLTVGLFLLSGVFGITWRSGLLTGIPRLARGHRRQWVEQKSSDLVDGKMRPTEFFGITGFPRSARGYHRQGLEQNFLALPDGNAQSNEIFGLSKSRVLSSAALVFFVWALIVLAIEVHRGIPFNHLLEERQLRKSPSNPQLLRDSRPNRQR